MKGSPKRTCIGCRKKRKKEEMLWFVQSPEGAVLLNKKEPRQGRGFYLCPDRGCFNLAKKKKRGVGFLETMDFRYPLAEGFSKSEKVW